MATLTTAAHMAGLRPSHDTADDHQLPGTVAATGLRAGASMTFVQVTAACSQPRQPLTGQRLRMLSYARPVMRPRVVHGIPWAVAHARINPRCNSRAEKEPGQQTNTLTQLSPPPKVLTAARLAAFPYPGISGSCTAWSASHRWHSIAG